MRTKGLKANQCVDSPQLDAHSGQEATSQVDRAILEERASQPMKSLPRPFLKWAGSKRSLAAQIVPSLPDGYGTYWEPFLGGGSLFFLLQPERAILGDLCAPLIETYEAVAADPGSVFESLSRLPVNKEAYYKIRSSRPRLSHTQAARFIYLNKTCWNGLYRENLSGHFNVPFGRPKSSRKTSMAVLGACAAQLGKPSVVMRQGDFESVLEGASAGDLVFLDPPYATTAPRRSTFLEYNGRIFSWSDQERLATLACDLADRGCSVLVTNSSAPEIARLYESFSRVDLLRSSTISGQASQRGLATESLFVRLASGAALEFAG